MALTISGSNCEPEFLASSFNVPFRERFSLYGRGVTMSSKASATAMMKLDMPDHGLRAIPVASLVNSIRNNGPELITPIELGEPQTLF